MPSVLDTNNALITLAALKSYLAADDDDEFLTDTKTDNELELLINSASVMANRYTGVDLLSRAHTEYYDGDGRDTLYLNHFPVSSSVSEIDLWCDIDRDYSTADKIASDKIILYSNLGKIRLEDTVFPAGPQSVKITYTAGYSISAVPADLGYAIKLICAAWWKAKKNKLTSISGMTVEGQSVTLREREIPELALQILDQFSREK